MAHQSFSQSVLAAVTTLVATHAGEASTDDISNSLGIKTHLEHKRILNTLSDLSRAGRVRRIRQGVYGLPLAQRPAEKVEKRRVMWNVLRMRRRVTVEDLVVMAEVSPSYAKEWLAALVKREVVRKQQQPGLTGTWQLINDTVDMPEDDAKAAKLRALRRTRKEAVAHILDNALKNLQTIGEALSKARDVIDTMEEGE